MVSLARNAHVIIIWWMWIPDDIVEAYKRLRRLVMDYLGISAPTPSISNLEAYDTDTNLLDKELTGENFSQAPSANNLARTWSKPSLADSATQQAMANLKAKMGSPMPPAGRGIVVSILLPVSNVQIQPCFQWHFVLVWQEERSLKRRQSAAKEAVSGTRPTIFDHIMQRSAFPSLLIITELQHALQEAFLNFSAPRTVPQSLSATMGLGDSDTWHSNQRAYSAPDPNMDALPPTSPDSSESRSGGDSSLSNISEARDIDEEPGSQPESPTGSQNDLQLPADALDRITLVSSSGSNKNQSANGKSLPLAPRPVSAGSRPGSGRPGSDRHPVLPPIGQSPRPVEMLPEV